MKENDVQQPFIADIVEARSRLSLGSSLNEIHGLASVAGLFTGSEFFMGKGNADIVYGFLHNSNAYVELQTQVTKISRKEEDGKYMVTTTKATASGDVSKFSAPYDAVVIAAPFLSINVSFDFDLENPPNQETTYLPVHVTLFTSPFPHVSPLAFGKTLTDPIAPNILSTNPPAGVDAPKFYSIRVLRNVTYLDDNGIERTEYVFRVASAC